MYKNVWKWKFVALNSLQFHMNINLLFFISFFTSLSIFFPSPELMFGYAFVCGSLPFTWMSNVLWRRVCTSRSFTWMSKVLWRRSVYISSLHLNVECPLEEVCVHLYLVLAAVLGHLDPLVQELDPNIMRLWIRVL